MSHVLAVSAADIPELAKALAAPAVSVKCLASMADKILSADPDATVIVVTLAPVNLSPFLRFVPLVKTLIGSLNKALSLVSGKCSW